MDDSRIGAWFVLGLFVFAYLWVLIDNAISYYKACKKVKIGGLYFVEHYELIEEEKEE